MLPNVLDSQERDLHDQIKAAPCSNRLFHAPDLCRLIGQAAFDARVFDVIRLFESSVHGGSRGLWTIRAGWRDRAITVERLAKGM